MNLKKLNITKIVLIACLGLSAIQPQISEAIWNPFKKLTQHQKNILKLLTYGAFGGGVIDYARLGLNQSGIATNVNKIKDTVNFYKESINSVKAEIAETANLIKGITSDLSEKELKKAFKSVFKEKDKLAELQSLYITNASYNVDLNQSNEKIKSIVKPFIKGCSIDKDTRNVCESATVTSLLNIANNKAFVERLINLSNRLDEISKIKTNTVAESNKLTNEILSLKVQARLSYANYKMNKELLQANMSLHQTRLNSLNGE